MATPLVSRPFARLAALVALASALACAPFGANPSRGGRVGTRPIQIVHAGLARAVQGQIWYPAAGKANERTVFYSSMVWGRAAPGAQPSPAHGRPLIILAHGWRGTRFDLSWLGEALARQGYVAAAINMPDSDAETFQNAQAPKVWFRANLLSKLIDAVGESPVVGALVDTSRVAVIGHSAGGSAALVLGGATVDPQRFAAIYPEAAPVVEGDWHDARVAALVALNPGTGPAFSPEGLSHVHVPLLVVSGSGDDVAPEDENAGFYAQHIAGASWLRFAGVDHYSFMPVCSPWGRLRRFGACIESHGEVDRGYVHAQTLGRVEAFLRQNLPLAAKLAPTESPVLPPFVTQVSADRPAAPPHR